MNPSQTPFADVTKVMSQFQPFKMQGLDIASLLEARGKDIEAMTTANRQTIEGLQSLAQHQAQAMQEIMTQWQSLASPANAQNPGDAQARQLDVARRSIESMMANFCELSEILGSSQRATLEAVSRRAAENIEDMKKMIQRSS